MTILKSLFIFGLFLGVAKADEFMSIGSPISVNTAAGCASPPIFVSSHTSYFATITSSNIKVNNVQAGDWINAAWIQNVSAPAVPFVVTDSCSPGSTYTLRIALANSAAPTTVQVFTATSNCTANPLTVNITYPGSHDGGGGVIVARNVSGYDTGASGTEAGSGTTFNTGNFTTTLANSFYFSVLGNENTAVTNMSLTSSAVSLTQFGVQLSNTANYAYGISTTQQTNKNATYSWTTASTDGVGIIVVGRGSCGL